ncbi:hypothetical protein QFC19_002934 [Naganishia cerealis]|uniref:Uncharacterized protein n=1 Tax=Naganishia cerealis TaxID=610337 RepID=A0ACC2W5Q4_9TREE|nr:hypothetical protein QFC19_002934 [Naganishia cerealis]
MPDDVAIEKVHILETLGADVVRVRPAATDGDDIVATIAEDSGESDEQRFRPRGFFADQFEFRLGRITATMRHIIKVLDRRYGNKREVTSMVSFTLPPKGTGGSLSGTATYLKQRNSELKVVLSDPEGSGLYNRVKYGVMFDVKEKEGRKRR